MFVIFEFPDSKVDRNKFFDKVVPLVEKGGIELALERNFDYDLYKVMDDYGKSSVSNAVFTEDNIGKTVQWTGFEEEGTIVGVAKGRATVEMNDGSEKQVRSQDIAMHLEDLVLIDENS